MTSEEDHISKFVILFSSVISVLKSDNALGVKHLKHASPIVLNMNVLTLSRLIEESALILSLQVVILLEISLLKLLILLTLN